MIKPKPQKVNRTNAITAQVMINESKHGIKLFRNHRGKAWQGKSHFNKEKKIVIIENPRFFEFGLYPGAGDLIGWKEIIITKEMVGQKVAIFTSEEIKSLNDRMSPAQNKWHDIVRMSGGISKIAKEQKDGVIKYL